MSRRKLCLAEIAENAETSKPAARAGAFFYVSQISQRAQKFFRLTAKILGHTDCTDYAKKYIFSSILEKKVYFCIRNGCFGNSRFGNIKI
jgi:hypothetical protein